MRAQLVRDLDRAVLQHPAAPSDVVVDLLAVAGMSVRATLTACPAGESNRGWICSTITKPSLLHLTATRPGIMPIT